MDEQVLSSGQGWVFWSALIVLVGYVYYKLAAGEDIWTKHGVARSKISWYTTIKMILSEPIHNIDNAKYLELNEGRKMFGGYEGGKPILFVTDFELLKEVFIKDFSSFSSRRTINFTTEGKAISKSLAFLQGQDWKDVRTVMSVFFSSGKLKQMSSLIVECANRMMDKIKDLDRIDLKKTYRSYSLDVNMICSFSVTINTEQTADNPFATHSNRLTDQDIPLSAIVAIMMPNIARRLGLSIFPATAIKFFENIAYEIIEERKNLKQTKNRVDFLQVMLDSLAEEQEGKFVKTKLDYETVVGQCIAMLMFGGDTNSSSMTFTTYFLALNPDCQERAYQEIRSVLAKNNNELTYESLGDFKYIDMCVSEALRLLPPTARAERMAVKDTTLDGVPIPKGTIVIAPIYSIQNDAKYYPNPSKFDPERFTPENKSKRDAFAYQPFGMGPRNCVGMRFALISTKIGMIKLLQNYRIETCEQTPNELQYYRLNGPMALKSKIIVKIIKRI